MAAEESQRSNELLEELCLLDGESKSLIRKLMAAKEGRSDLEEIVSANETSVCQLLLWGLTDSLLSDLVKLAIKRNLLTLAGTCFQSLSLSEDDAVKLLAWRDDLLETAVQHYFCTRRNMLISLRKNLDVEDALRLLRKCLQLWEIRPTLHRQAADLISLLLDGFFKTICEGNGGEELLVTEDIERLRALSAETSDGETTELLQSLQRQLCGIQSASGISQWISDDRTLTAMSVTQMTV